MKRRSLWALALCAALLLCSACAGKPAAETAQAGEYRVYFTAAPEENGASGRTDSAALDWETRALPQGMGEIEGLLHLLLSGPESDALASPFPAGVSLQAWGQDDGTVSVDLSEAYGGLSGMELTLADSCIVLTLCRLEGVEAVYLTVAGRPRPYQDKVLTPEDFLLSNLDLAAE